ncbi:hypothetical protein BX600DRAFT_536017 [Xylariales sp. PMI_506]|nr:hypothetical protein BX600DRAFT_536017 [Xylariales sp. PMI_506]
MGRKDPDSYPDTFSVLDNDGEVPHNYPFSRAPRIIGRPEGGEKGNILLLGTRKDWKFTMTLNGLFLMVREQVQEGDIVVVMDGGKVPVILRKAEGVSTDSGDQSAANLMSVYRFVCVAYVHGFMDGEAELGMENGTLLREEFTLVRDFGQDFP